MVDLEPSWHLTFYVSVDILELCNNLFWHQRQLQHAHELVQPTPVASWRHLTYEMTELHNTTTTNKAAAAS